MAFEIAPEDHPQRVAIRTWLESNPQPSAQALAEVGYVAPHWPEPYGLGADPVTQLVIDEELRAAGVKRPSNPIGIGWAGPTLIEAGTAEQQSRYLPGILSGADIWCQLFSEPGAGSDLADLSTRAVRDGDEWVISGQKVWTSLAHYAKYGILIARTDPDVPKRKGISYFVCDMSLPGIEIRPLVEMTGVHNFNEVFLDEVRLPADALVGDVNDGWRLAKVTLANERVSLSSGGALWGMGPDATDLLEEIRQAGGIADPVLRQRVAQMYIHHEILRQIRLRTITAVIQGRQPGPEASVRKVLADEHGQEIMAIAKDLAGAGGMLTDRGPLGRAVGLWHYGYLFSQALTIGGGTGDVQRNILGERVLGLPAEIDQEAGATWAESHAARRSGSADDK